MDCKSGNENNKDFGSSDIISLNGSKNNLIYESKESENDVELENEQKIKIEEGHTDTEKKIQPKEFGQQNRDST